MSTSTSSRFPVPSWADEIAGTEVYDGHLEVLASRELGSHVSIGGSVAYDVSGSVRDEEADEGPWISLDVDQPRYAPNEARAVARALLDAADALEAERPES